MKGAVFLLDYLNPCLLKRMQGSFRPSKWKPRSGLCGALPLLTASREFQYPAVFLSFLSAEENAANFTIQATDRDATVGGVCGQRVAEFRDRL